MLWFRESHSRLGQRLGMTGTATDSMARLGHVSVDGALNFLPLLETFPTKQMYVLCSLCGSYL